MARPPNLLVVLSDQQRPDTCGVYGQALPVTPTLDALATRGVVFDAAFTVQPLCGPARAAIQSGQMPTAVGCWRNDLALPRGIPTLATRLAALGYWTGYVGKWHLATDAGPGRDASRPTARYARAPIPPERRGGYQDAWVAADVMEATSGPTSGHLFGADGQRVRLQGYRVDAVTDIVLGIFEARRRSGDARPFLQFVSYLEPHHQNSRLRSIGPSGWARRFRSFEVPGDLVGRFGDWRWNYPEVLACCASIDANLGRLLQDLEKAGELDDTLVVYSSDHGSHFRTRNLEYKRSCHDASIRVPLVLAGPGFRGGLRNQKLVSHLDLLPTALRLAGAPDDASLHGAPLQDALGDAPWRQQVLVQISESQIGRALRTGAHTYAVRAAGWNLFSRRSRPRADRYVEDHLYDNVADPHQRRDLVRDPASAALRAALSTRLQDEIERLEGHRPSIQPRG